MLERAAPAFQEPTWSSWDTSAQGWTSWNSGHWGWHSWSGRSWAGWHGSETGDDSWRDSDREPVQNERRTSSDANHPEHSATTWRGAGQAVGSLGGGGGSGSGLELTGGTGGCRGPSPGRGGADRRGGAEPRGGRGGAAARGGCGRGFGGSATREAAHPAAGGQGRWAAGPPLGRPLPGRPPTAEAAPAPATTESAVEGPAAAEGGEAAQPPAKALLPREPAEVIRRSFDQLLPHRSAREVLGTLRRCGAVLGANSLARAVLQMARSEDVADVVGDPQLIDPCTRVLESLRDIDFVNHLPSNEAKELELAVATLLPALTMESADWQQETPEVGTSIADQGNCSSGHPAQRSLPDPIHFVGKVVHIVTKAGLVYEGAVEESSAEDKTVSLLQVRCLGSEDGRVAPSRKGMFSRIVFSTADVRTFRALEEEDDAPAKALGLDVSDPAIVSISRQLPPSDAELPLSSSQEGLTQTEQAASQATAQAARWGAARPTASAPGPALPEASIDVERGGAGASGAASRARRGQRRGQAGQQQGSCAGQAQDSLVQEHGPGKLAQEGAQKELPQVGQKPRADCDARSSSALAPTGSQGAGPAHDAKAGAQAADAADGALFAMPIEWSFAPLKQQTLTLDQDLQPLAPSSAKTEGKAEKAEETEEAEDPADGEAQHLEELPSGLAGKKVQSVRAQQIVQANAKRREKSRRRGGSSEAEELAAGVLAVLGPLGFDEERARALVGDCGGSAEAVQEAVEAVLSGAGGEGDWATQVSRRHRRERDLEELARLERQFLEDAYGPLSALASPEPVRQGGGRQRGGGAEKRGEGRELKAEGGGAGSGGSTAGLGSCGVATMPREEVRLLLQRVKPMSKAPLELMDAAAQRAISELINSGAQSLADAHDAAVWRFAAERDDGRSLAGRPFFEAFLPLLTKHLEDVPGVCLVYALGSFTLVGGATQSLFSSAATSLLLRLRGLPAEALARLTWCFARARIQHTALFAGVAAEVVSRCDSGGEAEASFSPAALNDMFWACARFSYRHGPLLRVLKRRLAAALAPGPRGPGRFRLPALVPVVDAQVALGCGESVLMDSVADYCIEGLSLPSRDAERFTGAPRSSLAGAARAFVAAGICRRELFDLLKATATRRREELRKEDLDEIWRCARQAAQEAEKRERAKSAPPPRQRGSMGRMVVEPEKLREREAPSASMRAGPSPSSSFCAVVPREAVLDLERQRREELDAASRQPADAAVQHSQSRKGNVRPNAKSEGSKSYELSGEK